MSSAASISAGPSSPSSLLETTRPTASFTVLPMPTGEPMPTGTGNGDDPGSSRPIASSAALYLYTFLATLVLLLTVSAAIVIRSFILRRRHRRLVEEAIRNGTWVPPSPPSSTRAPRVDLSKKPIMWEAYLGSNEPDVGGGSYGGSVLQEDVKDWDAIKPVSAAYLAPKPSPDLSGTLKASANATSYPTASNATAMFASGLRAAPRYAWRGLRWLAGYPPRPDPSDPSSLQNGGGGSGIGGDASGTAGLGKAENPPTTGPDGGPPVVRVAVIIQMPQPPKPSPTPMPSSSSTPSTSALGATQNHPLAQPAPSRPPDGDDEEPLPIMEMGVAELVMVGQEHHDDSLGVNAKAPLGRESSSIRTVEV